MFFDNLDEYLSSLAIEIDIFSANDSNLLRIAQMTQKTNQFNLTTKRYTEDQLRVLISDGAFVFCAQVKDKFGDNGITVAAIITHTENEQLHLDSYLLSCRILGREIEKVVLLKILTLVNPQTQKPVNATYIPTSKNAQAANFLEKTGFFLTETTSDGAKKYLFDSKENIEIKDYYKITIK
jgi:FkbH-like protein